MVMQRLIWQGYESCKFEVVDEGPEPFVVKAKPIITNFYFGNTVGLFFRNSNGFGYWRSTNVCGPIIAWRVAQLLLQVKTMRQAGDGYDSTVTGLVIAMQGDREKRRLRKRAKDLDMSVEELVAELDRLNKLWPSNEELRAMWDRLPPDQQEKFAPVIRGAMNNSFIPRDEELFIRIEQAELRVRTAEQQREHENELIAAGLEPEVSLRQFMVDIGVTNLVETLSSGEIGSPSHFEFNELDRAIMYELIGDQGIYKYVPLLTTEKQPDDPSAHFSEGKRGGSQMFWSDFGKTRIPRIPLGGETVYLTKVRWDRVTERFQLLICATNDREAEGTWMSIEEIRRQVGTDIEWKVPIPPDLSRVWCPPQFPAAKPKKRKLFGR